MRRSLALAVALLAAVAVAAGPPAPPKAPLVTVAVSGSPISPNGDGIRERARIAVTVDSAATLTVGVHDRHGALVASLTSATPVDAGQVNFVWNGHADDGTYTVTARAVGGNGAAGQGEAKVVVDTAQPRVAWRGRWAQRVFTGVLPLALAVADRAGSRVRLRMVLYDQTGDRLAERAAPPRATGTLRLGWHPHAGLVSGAYRVEVSVTDEAGNTRAARTRPFLVERRAHPRTVAHVRGVGRRVALTFDDCGSPSAWESILQTLRARHVKAAFFCPGEYVLAAPAEARRTLHDGHTIGSHGWDHANFERLSYAAARRRLIADREAWWHLAKASPTPFFRPPYGAYNRTAYAAAGKTGYAMLVLWDVDPNDWRQPGVGVIVSRVLGAVRPGSIVLLHVAPQTAAALPAILNGLRSRGLHPACLGELLRTGRWDRRHWPRY